MILGDALPDLVCTKCVVTIVNMYNFKIQCINSDRILRERLHRITYQNEDLKSEETESAVKIELVKDYQDDIILEGLDTLNIELPKSDTENVSISNDLQEKPIEESIVEDSEVTENQNDFMVDDFHNHDDSENEISAEEVNSTQEKSKQVKDKKFQCEICQKSFSRNDLLLRHKIVHAIKMEEEMNEQMQFLSNKNGVILSHVQLKNEHTMYPCLKCDIAFQDEEALKRHMTKSHQEKQHFNIPCEVCGKKFSTLSHKKRHLRTTHFKDRHYRCPTCNKSFSRKEQFNHHMNGHSGLKPHICDICFKGKLFMYRHSE